MMLFGFWTSDGRFLSRERRTKDDDDFLSSLSWGIPHVSFFEFFV